MGEGNECNPGARARRRHEKGSQEIAPALDGSRRASITSDDSYRRNYGDECGSAEREEVAIGSPSLHDGEDEDRCCASHTEAKAISERAHQSRER